MTDTGALDMAALYATHRAGLYGYVRRRLEGADPAVIEDLVADVWERAVRSAPRYRDTGAPTEVWLRRIARNLLTDRYRERSRRVTICRLGDIQPMVTHVGTPDHVRRIDAQDSVERALPTLTEAQRAVIRARFFDGLRIREAAAATGHSEDGVKKLQDRALTNLKRALEAA